MPSTHAILHPCKNWRGKAITAEQVDLYIDKHPNPILKGAVELVVNEGFTYLERGLNVALWVGNNKHYPMHHLNPTHSDIARSFEGEC